MRIQVRRLHLDDVTLPLTEGGAGTVRALVWPGMGARHRTMHHVTLQAGARTVPHHHAASEAVYYVLRGHGAVEDLNLDTQHVVGPGSFVLITPGTGYRIAAAADRELVCVGGPCPPDPRLYAAQPGGSS